MKDIFIYGLSGSGKDTIANFLRDNYGYYKVRNAKTIKQVICETNGMGIEELENRKREESNLREAHWKVGGQLDKISNKNTKIDHSMNRLKQLIHRTSIEFEGIKDLNQRPLVFCDIRMKSETEECLKSNVIGIFLARLTKEFRGDGTHKTENYIFNNGDLEEFISKYPNVQKLLIYNDINYSANIQRDNILDMNNLEGVKAIYTGENINMVLTGVENFIRNLK